MAMTQTNSKLRRLFGLVWKPVLLLVIVGALVYAFKFRPIAVVSHEVVRGSIVSEVMGTGTLESRVSMMVSPKIAGRIMEVSVDQGDRVEAGQLLVRLDDAQLQQQVAIAQAQLDSATSAIDRLLADGVRADTLYAQADRDNQQTLELFADGAATQDDADRASEALTIAQSGVARSAAALAEGRSQRLAAQRTYEYQQALLADTQIVAPFDGLIVRRHREAGDIVVPGSAILSLISTQEMWISAWVDETQMSALALDQSARVVFRSQTDHPYAGRVARLGREADRETREFVVEVRTLDLPDHWAVGQRAEVYIESARKESVVLLPSHFVVIDQGQSGVFVSEDGKARWRPVTLGLRNAEHLEVVEGLAAGDVVVKRRRCTSIARGAKDQRAMNLAYKDVRHSFGRYALTAVGIGMLLMIVMGMGGIYRGIEGDATQLIDTIGCDVWVVQRDTRGPFAEVSRVPSSLVDRVSAVPGVALSREFVYHTIQRDHAGRSLRMSVLGLDWPSDKGDWLPLVAGRPLRQNHYEMIADQSLGLYLGERYRIGKDTYRVVGMTQNMISASGDGIIALSANDAQQVQFDTPGEAVRLERAARAARGARSEIVTTRPSMLELADQPAAQLPAIAKPQASAVMIRVAPGADAQAVAKIIAGWGDVSVFTHHQQRELIVRGTVDRARRQIALIRVLLTAVAAIVMALILYTLTLDKIHSIALLKLLGAPNTVILGMILQQALFLGGLGFVIAYLLGQKIFPHFPRRVILINQDLIQLALIVLGISVVSSLLGIAKALRVSPNAAIG